MIQVEQHDGHANIILPEVIDFTNTPLFKQTLNSLYAQDYNTINLDCGYLEMIHSPGLTMIKLGRVTNIS